MYFHESTLIILILTSIHAVAYKVLPSLSQVDDLAKDLEIILIRIRLNNTLRYCCGSLITSLIVLTAAHCFYSDDHSQISVRKVRVIVLSNSQKFRPIKVFINPHYNDWNLDNDVALLKLPKNVLVKNQLQLPLFLQKHTFKKHNNCILFGHTNNRFYTKIDNLDKCHKYLTDHNAAYTDNMFCGDWHNPRHSCYGDSGCPIVCEGQGIVGIVSFSTSCDASAPVVFTNITVIKDWINVIIPVM